MLHSDNSLIAQANPKFTKTKAFEGAKLFERTKNVANKVGMNFEGFPVQRIVAQIGLIRFSFWREPHTMARIICRVDEWARIMQADYKSEQSSDSV